VRDLVAMPIVDRQTFSFDDRAAFGHPVQRAASDLELGKLRIGIDLVVACDRSPKGTSLCAESAGGGLKRVTLVPGKAMVIFLLSCCDAQSQNQFPGQSANEPPARSPIPIGLTF
jgi:hypothetical protein